MFYKAQTIKARIYKIQTRKLPHGKQSAVKRQLTKYIYIYICVCVCVCMYIFATYALGKGLISRIYKELIDSTIENPVKK